MWIFVVGLAFVLLFASLIFAIWIVASQCISEIEGTEAGERLKQAIVTVRPSTFIPSLDGCGPMNSRVWFALQQAQALPETVQRKAQTIGRLYSAAKLVFIALVIAMVVTIVVSIP